MIIETKEFGQVEALVKIHSHSLKGDFLPSLGIQFLTKFYLCALTLSDTYVISSLEKKKVVGFVLGTKDMDFFFKNVLKKGLLRFIPILLFEFIKNPKIIRNVFETLVYTKKESGSKAELVVIAVDKKYRGQGIGKILVKQLEKVFQRNKVRSYKATVHSDKKSISFYEHLGFKRISAFKLYEKEWLVFEKSISGL